MAENTETTQQANPAAAAPKEADAPGNTGPAREGKPGAKPFAAPPAPVKPEPETPEARFERLRADLVAVKGIGPATAEALLAAGIETPEQLASTNGDTLDAVKRKGGDFIKLAELIENKELAQRAMAHVSPRPGKVSPRR